VDTLDLATLS